jgi:hypothetical protein
MATTTVIVMEKYQRQIRERELKEAVVEAALGNWKFRPDSYTLEEAVKNLRDFQDAG